MMSMTATHRHMMTRRQFLGHTAAGLAAGLWIPRQLPAAEAEGSQPNIRVGTCTLSLEQARQAGLDGVEVGAGNAAPRLSIAEPKVQEEYKRQMKQTGLPICSLMMGLLNSYPLASDPRAPAWLEQSIDAAAALGARVILVAFFGKGDLLDAQGQVKQGDLDVVVERLKAAAPRAKAAGVILAIENYLNGEQNARLLDRIGHESVQLYYDVYNTGVTKGHNVPADVRLLAGRIAQFHFKNGPKYLDQDRAMFESIAAAIKGIGYRGWVVLETSSPSKDPVADARRNGQFVRELFA
jgi:sugar phosphate isomerase/epimerase